MKLNVKILGQSTSNISKEIFFQSKDEGHCVLKNLISELLAIEHELEDWLNQNLSLSRLSSQSIVTRIDSLLNNGRMTILVDHVPVKTLDEICFVSDDTTLAFSSVN